MSCFGGGGIIDMAAATGTVLIGAALQAMSRALLVEPEAVLQWGVNDEATAWPAVNASLERILEEVDERLTDTGRLAVRSPHLHPPCAVAW